MTKTTSTALLLLGLLTMVSSAAIAQTAATAQPSSAFIDVNGGGQTQSRTLESSTSFPLYGETAVVNAAQNIGSGGLFDISGGYRIRPNIGVAVGFSTFHSSGDGALSASIPNPLVFGRPAVVNVTGSDLKRSENGAHIMAVFFIPVDDKFEVTVFGGPSFIKVSQDVLTASVVTGTQTANVATVKQSGTAKGGNVGISGNYFFRTRYGVGVFIRYAGGSVDLSSASDVKTGGFQIGGGLRLRFL